MMSKWIRRTVSVLVAVLMVASVSAQPRVVRSYGMKIGASVLPSARGLGGVCTNPQIALENFGVRFDAADASICFPLTIEGTREDLEQVYPEVCWEKPDGEIRCMAMSWLLDTFESIAPIR